MEVLDLVLSLLTRALQSNQYLDFPNKKYMERGIIMLQVMHNIIPILAESLPYAWYCTKRFRYIALFNPHKFTT